MNLFDSASLSPLPKKQFACDLPYGLTWDDLVPVLPDFAARENANPQSFSSHDKQGYAGSDSSCILTLSYPAKDNQVRSETVFIKQTTGHQKREAQKYRFIASQGVPTPRLLGVFQKGTAEVILLEFLETIGIDFNSAGEVTGLLHLAAQLNALQNPPELFSSQPGMPQAEFEELVKAALSKMPIEPARPAIDVPRWFNAYRAAQQASTLMPLAVNHNQFYFQQVGWAQRGSSRQLVIFDLETMALRPRFTDIATFLYPLAIYTGRSQFELFKIYLDRFNELTSAKLDDEPAFRELRVLRVEESCSTLPWLVDEINHPGALDINSQLSLVIGCLWDDLTALGLQ